MLIKKVLWIFRLRLSMTSLMFFQDMTDFYLITIFGDKDFRQNLFLDSFGEYSHSCTL